MSTQSQNADHRHPELDRLRDSIDAIDHQLLELLSQRNEIVGQVAQFKRSHSVPIRDYTRERRIIEDRCRKAIDHQLGPEAIESIFRLILWASRDRQAALKAELPSDLPNRTVAIIGGQGQMGRLFAAMFEDLGNEVLVSDVNTNSTNVAVARQADVVMICVPIHATVDVIREVAPVMRPDALIADITSIKSAPLTAMMECSSCEVVGTHPLFGPSIHSMQGQRMVLVPGRGTNGIAWLRAILRARGLLITETSPDEHDRAMAVVQVLTHFSTEVMGRTLQQFGLPLDQTLRFTSPVYTMELLMTARHFAQSSDLYAAIQMNNPMKEEALQTFLESAQHIAQIVRNGDRPALAEVFDDVHRFFGEFSEQALQQSSYLIDRLVERS